MNLKRKRIITFLFTGALMIHPYVYHAAEIQTQEITQDTVASQSEYQTTVHVSVQEQYTISIPKSISFASANEADYEIEVKGFIADSRQIIISPKDERGDIDGTNFMLHDTSGIKQDIIANVTQGNTVWTSADLSSGNTKKTGKISIPNLEVGEWEGMLSFTINIGDSPLEQFNSTTQETKSKETETLESFIGKDKTIEESIENILQTPEL